MLRFFDLSASSAWDRKKFWSDVKGSTFELYHTADYPDDGGSNRDQELKRRLLLHVAIHQWRRALRCKKYVS